MCSVCAVCLVCSVLQSRYKGIPNMHVIRLLEAGSRMNKLETCNDELYELLLDAWEENPENRPTFAALMPKLCAATNLPLPDF